jgi:hypothetical protein
MRTKSGSMFAFRGVRNRGPTYTLDDSLWKANLGLSAAGMRGSMVGQVERVLHWIANHWLSARSRKATDYLMCRV